MERERFVFTACNFILFFPGGCGEEQYRVPSCTHRGAGAEQGFVGFLLSPQPTLGLTDWQKSPVAFGS